MKRKGHPEWCGKPCADCVTSCALDESMPCSPDCKGLNNNTGRPTMGEICKGCDSIQENSHAN